MEFALNQATAPHLPFATFLDLAADAGCVGVEARNDLGRPLFDGLDPREAADMVAKRGLRFVGLSQVYPFNDWSEARMAEIIALAETAKACGAPGINPIPRVDGVGCGEAERNATLRRVIAELLPISRNLGVGGWIEPIGFRNSSLALKRELVEAIETLDAAPHIALVHDTFQHVIAHDPDLFADHTALVHISGVSDPDVLLDESQDAHRSLVEANDRLGNAEQIRQLRDNGYAGVFSFECVDCQ